MAPQAKAIQEKYKKYSMRDPRKQDMQKEICELYKKEGVNPIGGCLPLLIQLPFIWAYYKMLGGLIDLRHAHWLWIDDLSSRDPYFILPIAMVLSMILTQRMTPQAGMDPAQQKMMNWTMPLMMGFIFFNLAAGLNLYYAESNLVSDRPAVDHEPHQPGPRDAGDGREASAEEGQESIKLGDSVAKAGRLNTCRFPTRLPPQRRSMSS